MYVSLGICFCVEAVLEPNGPCGVLGIATYPVEGFFKYLQNPQSLFLSLSFSPPIFLSVHLASLGEPAKASSAVPIETTEPGPE